MLITDREAVLNIYAEAAERGWVIPCFCAENLTTLEAVLSAVKAHGRQLGIDDLPVILAATVNYPSRPQAQFYTQTRDGNLGLRLFMAELRELTTADSPFGKLRVMVHLDHIQPVEDAALLASDLRAYSSIMYDASHNVLAENIRTTRRFVEQWGKSIVIEGACDEIVDAGGLAVCRTTTDEEAAHYADATGVDLVVANLGTEHRAGASNLTYQGEAARAIQKRIGARIVLHGCSSVPMNQIRDLYQDGICKVNIWTILERDATPALFEAMLTEAAAHIGPAHAADLLERGYLGQAADCFSKLNLSRYTTSCRQAIIFERMQAITRQFLAMWYR